MNIFNLRKSWEKLRPWVYPRVGIKRWLFIVLIGMSLLIVGADLFWFPGILTYIGEKVTGLRELVLLHRKLWSVIFCVCGMLFIIYGFQRAEKAVKAVILPRQEKRLVELLFTRKYLERGPKIVVVGGGTGISVVLRGLKEYTSNITAVVTVTDDGGSSGRLRGEIGVLPPGDIRNCMLALADTEPLMEKIFQHRFVNGRLLEGHNLGNILIVALTEIMGFKMAIKEISKVLAVRGRILPVTLDNVTLAAETVDNRVIFGESNISSYPMAIKRIYLEPLECRPLPEIIDAIKEADIIVLGPGSLYTSIIPNLLVPGVKEAICNSSALRLYICNIMTQQGETDGYTVADHLEALWKHSSPEIIDNIIVNTDHKISPLTAEKYHKEGAQIVNVDYTRLRSLGKKIIAAPLINKNNLLRHDPEKLASTILEIFLSREFGKDKRSLDNLLIPRGDKILWKLWTMDK